MVTIPSIDLKPNDVNLPFKLKRRQFPVTAAFAMTINPQGCKHKPSEHVGVFWSEPVLSHGQLYVAWSRSPKSVNV